MSECNSVECNSIKKTYYQRNRDVILNRAKDYYENDKERLRDKYRNLSEEGKNVKREYGRNRYHDMSKKQQQKLKELSCNQKIKIKKFGFFSFHSIKNGTRSFVFW